MSILDSITTAKRAVPRRTLLYGIHGIGKSTFGAGWPGAVFLPTEDGQAHLDVPSFPLCKAAEDAWKVAVALGGEAKHQYQTLVIDSADWLERLIWDSVAKKHSKKHISEIPYNRGYEEAAGLMAEILRALDGVRGRGMHILFIAHCQIQKFESPEGDSYDRYLPKLHKTTSALLQEWCDEVLFTNYRVAVTRKDEGFGRSRGVGIGAGERTLYTTERPAWTAKNRLSLPDELPLDFETYQQFLTN